MPDYSQDAASFAEQLNIEFSDLVILRTALTHRSFLNEHPELGWEDNERLEYLGDAVLDFLLADYLYEHFPAAAEGELTALRAALVRRESLAQFAIDISLGERLFMGHGEVDSGGRERPATLCAAFEALVGALYLDQGLGGVRQLVIPLIEREMVGARTEAVDKDPKSRLQELTQGMLGLTPRYQTVRAEGPDHAKLFTVQVVVGEHVCGEGLGPSKQIAAQQAAANALERQECWPSERRGD